MSASPADHTPGRTPNGTLPPMMRRPKVADPLVRPKDKNRRKQQRVPTKGPNVPNGVEAAAHTNGGLTMPGQGKTQVAAQHPARSSVTDTYRDAQTIMDGTGAAHSGFTSPPVAPYIDFPLIMTKRSLMEGMRYHVARFYTKKNVDPRNEEFFTRPVRLHRRDPRAPAGGAGSKEEDTMAGVTSGNGSVDDKERERQQILREQREAEREAEMAQVAPAANSGGQRKLGQSTKKTQQVFRNDQTEEQKAGTKLRYEEALPWHLEDLDNKQTWVGTYEAALSETYAQLIRKDGKFYVTPMEKWYKFTTKAPFSTLTIDEAEKRMEKKVKDPRWFMESLQANKEKQDEQRNKKATSRLYVGKVSRQDDTIARNAGIKREAADVDELDFIEDRFADDEENQLFEGDDEDTKEAEDRIKRDQLQANIFDLKDEKAYENADVLEQKLKEAQRKDGKRVKKALMKREKNYVYDSDSDNPYSSAVWPRSRMSDFNTNSIAERFLRHRSRASQRGADQERGRGEEDCLLKRENQTAIRFLYQRHQHPFRPFQQTSRSLPTLVILHISQTPRLSQPLRSQRQRILTQKAQKEKRHFFRPCNRHFHTQRPSFPSSLAQSTTVIIIRT